MGAPQLLPGEHEELRLRPSAAGSLPAYGVALVPLFFGGLLWLLVNSASWKAGNDQAGTPSWQVWNHLWADDQALGLYVVVTIVLVALVDFAVRRRARTFVLATAALVFLMLGRAVLSGTPSGVGIPIAVAALCAPAIVWLEARRRTTTYLFTNLRMVIRHTMPRQREHAVRHQDLVDLRAKHLLADVGTLIPVLGKDASAAHPHVPTPRFTGIQPFGRVRAFVELLIQRATAGDYLRAEERLDQRIAEARSALQRKA